MCETHFPATPVILSWKSGVGRFGAQSLSLRESPAIYLNTADAFTPWAHRDPIVAIGFPLYSFPATNVRALVDPPRSSRPTPPGRVGYFPNTLLIFRHGLLALAAAFFHWRDILASRRVSAYLDNADSFGTLINSGSRISVSVQKYRADICSTPKRNVPARHSLAWSRLQMSFLIYFPLANAYAARNSPSTPSFRGTTFAF